MEATTQKSLGMRVILIASGEKLQHGHCKKKSSSGEVELFSVRSNGFMLHTLVTMITLPYRNDIKDFSHSHQSAMGTDWSDKYG